MGVDFVHVDVVLTNDRIPIVMQGPQLDKTTNIKDVNSSCYYDKFVAELDTKINGCFVNLLKLEDIKKLSIIDTRNEYYD